MDGRAELPSLRIPREDIREIHGGRVGNEEKRLGQFKKVAVPIPHFINGKQKPEQWQVGYQLAEGSITGESLNTFLQAQGKKKEDVMGIYVTTTTNTEGGPQEQILRLEPQNNWDYDAMAVSQKLYPSSGKWKPYEDPFYGNARWQELSLELGKPMKFVGHGNKNMIVNLPGWNNGEIVQDSSHSTLYGFKTYTSLLPVEQILIVTKESLGTVDSPELYNFLGRNPAEHTNETVLHFENKPLEYGLKPQQYDPFSTSIAEQLNIDLSTTEGLREMKEREVGQLGISVLQALISKGYINAYRDSRLVRRLPNGWFSEYYAHRDPQADYAYEEKVRNELQSGKEPTAERILEDFKDWFREKIHTGVLHQQTGETSYARGTHKLREQFNRPPQYLDPMVLDVMDMVEFFLDHPVIRLPDPDKINFVDLQTQNIRKPLQLKNGEFLIVLAGTDVQRDEAKPFEIRADAGGKSSVYLMQNVDNHPDVISVAHSKGHYIPQTSTPININGTLSMCVVGRNVALDPMNNAFNTIHAENFLALDRANLRRTKVYADRVWLSYVDQLGSSFMSDKVGPFSEVTIASDTNYGGEYQWIHTGGHFRKFNFISGRVPKNARIEADTFRIMRNPKRETSYINGHIDCETLVIDEDVENIPYMNDERYNGLIEYRTLQAPSHTLEALQKKRIAA